MKIRSASEHSESPILLPRRNTTGSDATDEVPFCDNEDPSTPTPKKMYRKEVSYVYNIIIVTYLEVIYNYYTCIK